MRSQLPLSSHLLVPQGWQVNGGSIVFTLSSVFKRDIVQDFIQILDNFHFNLVDSCHTNDFYLLNSAPLKINAFLPNYKNSILESIIQELSSYCFEVFSSSTEQCYIETNKELNFEIQYNQVQILFFLRTLDQFSL